MLGPRTQCFGGEYTLTWRQLGPATGNTWLVLADRFTGLVFEIYFPREATAKQLITIVREMFSTFGVAENIATDDGSQFRANEMENFLTRWGVEHRISSDYNPHANLS